MMAKVDGPLIVAAREGRPTGDHKLDALLSFTRDVTSSRGYPSANARSQLLSAGYTNSAILAVVLAVGIKTLSNYTNHIAETPIDAAFQPKG
jgi:alkylhydroperoxidase family enzyme